MSEQNLRIERTHDMGTVRPILAHPAIWPHIHDDGVTEPAPSDHPACYWLLVSDSEPAGVFLVHAQNTACFEVHTCLLPRIWGGSSTQAARMCIAWMFTNTACQKLITHVPSYNVTALRFAKKCGMVPEGINRKSFLRNGELLDQHLLGITKEEWLCQQQQAQ